MADLITIEELKAYLRIGDTGKDAILTPLVAGVSAAISAFLRWDPTGATVTAREYDGDGGTILDLGVKNLTAVTELSIDGTVIDPGYYEFYENGLIKMVEGEYSARLRRTSYIFPVGNKNISVTFTAGYGEIPEDLKLACKMWCGYVLNRRGEEARMNVSDAANNTTMTTLTKLPDDVRQLLRPYVKSFVRVI